MLVESRAPNRVLDFGGWTDTRFAGRGKVVNLAVTLFAHVTIRTRTEPGVTIHVLDYGDRIEVADVVRERYGTGHDLLLAALKRMEVRAGLDVYITADVPPGCGTGSSAAITVALLQALACIAGRPLVPHELAGLAHGIETEELGNECGIQDQTASAYGGINYIEMDAYPSARVSPIPLPEPLRRSLESRLLVVYEGAGHLSSDVHRTVIGQMEQPGSKIAETLRELADCAEAAKQALVGQDLERLAAVMDRNHALQKSLHPAISTPRLERIEQIGRDTGAVAAKINGAGGGGSITLLCRPGARATVAQALQKEGFRLLPFLICSEPATAWVAG